jgi:pilus assembly protein Flp/PilA
MLYMYCLLQNLARRPWKSEEGVTAIEYGLIAALIAVAIIGAVTTLSGNLQNTFNHVAGHLS